MTEDWTNGWDKSISLNSGFIGWILHKKSIGVEITVVVSCWHSLCWMLKVCIVESLRLSCLLICGYSMSSRWGWSLCLVQILGVAVWSGCCWRWSVMWMHWLQRLDDQCPGCEELWFNQEGCCWSGLEVLVLVQAVMLVAEAVLSMSQFIQSLVNWVWVDVASSVDANPSSESLMDYLLQML